MGSCEHSSVANEPLHRSPHLLTVRVVKGLLGCSSVEGSMKSHSCTDAASELLDSRRGFTGQSIIQRQSFSKVPCPFAEENMSALNVAGELSGSSQDDEICSLACTLHQSDVDCADASNGCPGGFSQNCDNSAVSLCNATEIPSVTRTRSDDKHAAIISVVPAKDLCDECKANEFCSNDSQLNGCEDLNNLSDLETDMFFSNTSFQCGDCSRGISDGCGVRSEELPTNDPINTPVKEDDSKIVSSCYVEKDAEVVGERNDVLDGIAAVGSYKQILPLHGGEVPLNFVDTGGLPSDYGQQKEQDTESVFGPTMERVTVLPEAKEDVPDREEVHFRTQIFTTDGACNSNECIPGAVLHVTVDNADSVQFPQLNGANDKSLKYLTEENLSGHHVLCAFNSNSVIDCSAQTDSEGNDNGGFDYVSEVKRSDMICSSPRRSARISNSSQKAQTKTAVRNGRKIAKNTAYERGIVDVFLKTARKKRTCFCKPARSSSWGLLGNVARVFGQYNALDINHVKSRGSGTARNGLRSGKQKKNHAVGSLQRPMVKIHSSTSRIRLKVKVGKEVCQNRLEVIVPEATDALPLSPATIDMPESRLETSDEFAEIANCVEDNVQKDFAGTSQLHYSSHNLDLEKTRADASIVDVQPADKDTESAVIIDSSIGNADESYFGISSQLDVEALGGISDNRYIDSGTSPDSEVINIAPDMLTGSKIEEDLRDVTLASSTVVDAHGDIKSSSLSNYNGKKGKKFDDFPQKSKCIVEKRMPGLSSKSKIRLSIKHGHKRNSGDGFSSTEIFDSIRKTASSNVSSNKDISKQILPSLSTEFGGCQGVLKVKYGAEAALDFGLNASVRSSKLQNSEKLPPSFNSNGEISRRSKSGKKSNKKSGCGSEAPGKTMSRRKDAFRLKENQTKLSKDKKAEVEEKGIAEQAACSLDDRSETGKHILDDLGKDNTDNKVASIDLSNLDMVSSGLEKQFCPPRIAWVSCDDCHKWRCIPATLADTIEETNCKWTCKDNMDKAFADCSISQVKSNAEINAELQISDASGEEDAYNSHLNSKCLEKRQLTAAQKSPWTLIKSNLFLHRNRRKQTIDEIMVCHCKPPADGRMGCGDACLNRMLNIECIRGTCPCGELCSNQQFQKRKYAKMKSFKCGKKGYGLQSQENISVGKFLIEYVGEVLDLPTYEARQKEYASRGHKHFYFMTLNGSEVIDACAKGNLGRFINHSCDPNCRTEKWMVNGEVCVGLFAVREIKKGEEVTFDYNYVRVFGAAAKKCVCGSSQCRGYIGGDPLNAEVIVQGDSDEEYPEPLMVCEDSVAGDGADTNTAEILLKNKDEVDEPADAMAQLDVDCMDNRKSTIDISDVTEVQTAGMSFSHRDKIEEHENFRKMKIVSQSKNSLEMEKDLMGKLSSEVQLQPVEISLQTEDPKSKSIHNVQEKISMEETVKKPSCSTQRLDTYSLSKVPRKLLSGSIDSKSDTLEDKGVLSKLDPLPRPSRSSSSVKKGKSTYKVLVANKPHMVALSDKKGRSISNASANARLEGVEDKLNELLDAEGGISRRKDSPRGYLKLLLLTAASGDRSNGEAIQSTRDLSMILDALLKTKSRVVLVDIINKNGLRMLHNIMKQYRRDFNKTPVLRKLLKVLEYLGMREILTSEHINGGPPCPGMESFRESILALTEHADKQVHQIARNFRDRWMPWIHRKFGCMDRDDSRIELHKGLNCNSSATNSSWHDQGVRPIEAIDNISVAGNEESCSIYGGGHSTNGATPRKRKSRWDGPADANKELNTESNLHKFDSNSNWAAEEVKGIQDDVPPGFSSMLSKTYSTITDLPQQSVSLSKWPFEIVTGRVQERFNSRLPISYGIPLLTVQQFGTPWTQTLNSWVVAPGMPFHPFPPLPPLPHDKRDTSPACVVELTTLKRPREAAFVGHNSQMDQNSPSTSGASPPDMNVQDTDNLKRMKGASYDLGRKYFKQQKLNNSKSRPPLPWKRNSCRFMGHNARSGMCNTAMGNSASNVRSMYSSEDVSNRMQSNDNTCYRHEQGQNQH